MSNNILKELYDTEERKKKEWDILFLKMAELMASKSKCFRSQCGAVIVKDGKHPISFGYNSSPVNQPNCTEIGFCYRDKNQIQSGTHLELCRAVGSHSESNAINIAAKLGVSTDGCTMYIFGNTDICNQCRGMIANAGIKRVVYRDKNQQIREYIPERDWVIHPIDQKGEG